MAADRHFAELRDQVNRMQADRDKTDQRLESLEIDVADQKRAAQDASGKKAAQPRAVQLGGAGDTEDEIGDATGRQEIRVQGTPGSSPRSGRGKSARDRENDPSSSSSSLREGGARPSALDPDAKKAYEAALALVQGKQYDRGLEGLTAFLVRWPDHPYAENATYWRGEAYYAQGEYLRAAEQFEAVLARFGAGTKGPDALLKLGMCHERLGSPQRARDYWDRLKSDFPKSDAAKRIPAVARTSSDSNRATGPKENR